MSVLNDTGSTKLDRANPFNKLLLECNNDSTRIARVYVDTRASSLAASIAAFQSSSFAGPTPDPILSRLLAHSPDSIALSPPRYPSAPKLAASTSDHDDPRYNLALLALPPPHITTLIAQIQARLHHAAPRLWLAPRANLHMTTLEIANSLSSAEECALKTNELCTAVDVLSLCDLNVPDGTAVLYKPLLTFDARAVALTFIPAVPSSIDKSDAPTRTTTYHALRAAVYAAVVGPPARRTGISVNSRYVAASAHVTVARFVTTPGPAGGVDFVTRVRKQGPEDEVLDVEHVEREAVDAFVAAITEINAWLKQEYWPYATAGGGAAALEEPVRRGDGQLLKVRGEDDGPRNAKKRMFEAEELGQGRDKTDEGESKGTWDIGRETGLQLRNGRSWYGGGDVVVLDKGYAQPS